MFQRALRRFQVAWGRPVGAPGLQTLANAAESVCGFLGIANVFSANADEESWIQLTPALGDYPHAKGLQRIDSAGVSAMANHFNSLGAKMGRLFGGVPMYIGHPDVPGLANDYPDKKAYGWVTALEARAEGLFGKVKWSGPGKELLANAHYKFFSPFWNGSEVGTAQGKKIYRPVELVSVGLTNQPNLPVNPLANEEVGRQKEEVFMERNALLTALGLANTATDAEITTRLAACVAAYTSLANVQTERDNAKTALSNEQTAHTSTKSTLDTQLANARTELATHRKARAEMLVDAAITDGRVPLANRATWIADLEADFAGKSTALANVQKTVKTTAVTSGARRETDPTALANEAGRRDQVQALMNVKMGAGLSYDAAWAAVQREKPELFAAMTKPEGKV